MSKCALLWQAPSEVWLTAPVAKSMHSAREQDLLGKLGKMKDPVLTYRPVFPGETSTSRSLQEKELEPLVSNAELPSSSVSKARHRCDEAVTLHLLFPQLPSNTSQAPASSAMQRENRRMRASRARTRPGARSQLTYKEALYEYSRIFKRLKRHESILDRQAFDKARINLKLAYQIDQRGREEAVQEERDHRAAEKARDANAFLEKQRQQHNDWVKSIGGEEQLNGRRKIWQKNFIDKHGETKVKELQRGYNECAKAKRQARLKEADSVD